MSSPNNSHITDEMLSAFIDNVLPENEHKLVEAAIEADAEIAWRAQSLRQTVAYLNELPALAPPRSFALPANIGLAESQARSATANQPKTVQAAPVLQDSGFWNGLLDFLQGRNGIPLSAMAVTMALVILLIGGGFLYGDRLTQNLRNLTDATQGVTTSASSDAASSETEIALDTETASSPEAVAQLEEEEAADESTNALAIVEESSASESAASSDSEQDIPTTVSVASLPTTTSAPATSTLPSAEPTNTDFSDPAITPSRPLAQPTQTLLPAPEIALAQAPSVESDEAAASRPESGQSTSAVASSAAAAGPQSAQVQAFGNVATESATEDSTDAIASRKIDLPTAPAEEAAMAVDAVDAGVATNDESTVENQASDGSIEASTIIPFGLTTAADAASSGAASSGAASAGTTTFLSPTNMPAATSQPLPAIVLAVDEFTGALTGTIKARQDDGMLSPVALANIALVRLEAASLDEDGTIEYNAADAFATMTDNDGLFIILQIVPGTYALFIEADGAQVRLGMPTDRNRTDNAASDAASELIIEIQAGQQTDLGTLEYETLP